MEELSVPLLIAKLSQILLERKFSKDDAFSGLKHKLTRRAFSVLLGFEEVH